MFALFCTLPPAGFAGDLWGLMMVASCGSISSEYEGKVGARIDAWRAENPDLDRRLQWFSLKELLAKKEVKQMFAGLNDDQMRKAMHQCDELIAALDEELKQKRESRSTR